MWGVTSLDPLESMRPLTTLNCSWMHSVTSLEPLAYLQGLQCRPLAGQLGAFGSVTTLDCSHMRNVTSLESLASLRSLSTIYCSNMGRTNIFQPLLRIYDITIVSLPRRSGRRGERRSRKRNIATRIAFRSSSATSATSATAAPFVPGARLRICCKRMLIVAALDRRRPSRDRQSARRACGELCNPRADIEETTSSTRRIHLTPPLRRKERREPPFSSSSCARFS